MNYELFLTFERVVRYLSAFESDSIKKRRASSATWLLLRYIDEGDNITGSDIATRFMIKPPTASQLIDRTVKQGLIERTSSKTDRRVYHLALTAKGKEQLQTLGEVFDERASRALKYLSTEEHRHLLALMDKMATGLQKELVSNKESLIA